MTTVIIIPIYKKQLEYFEKISVDRIHKIFKYYDIIFISPENLNTEFYKLNYLNSSFIFFNDCYFKGLNSYNKLMLNENFYNQFVKYDYMLICQPDVYIFKDNLDHFTNKNFCIIGAPLPNHIKYGIEMKYEIDFKRKVNFDDILFFNGGLSLRNIGLCKNLINTNKDKINQYLKHGWFEDVILSLLSYENKLCLPNFKEALSFSFELFPKDSYEKNSKKLPMGAHAWYRTNTSQGYNSFFWFKHITIYTKKKFFHCYYWYVINYYFITKKIFFNKFKIK